MGLEVFVTFNTSNSFTNNTMETYKAVGAKAALNFAVVPGY